MPYVIMALPAFLVLFFIMYVPMSGLVLAFKKYDYALGVFGSPWVGLDNFKIIIASKRTFITMTKNTLMYYLIFTAIGTVLNVAMAIAIDQLILKRFAKTMQTIMIVPVFISYAAVQFIVYAYISTDTGLINKTLIPFMNESVIPFFRNLTGNEIADMANIKFYTDAAKWPGLLTIVKIWKDVGYGSVLYMSVLAGIDTELYEAAEIDGANKWRRIWHITLPCLIPMITVMLLLSVGNIMKSDTGLFYQVTRDNGALYSTTQVIDSYVLHAVYKNSNFGFTAATSLFQSVVGLLLMLLANFTVRKIEPENALF